MSIDRRLLDTATWRVYASARGFLSGDIGDQLVRVGMAERNAGIVIPRRAAVLLFADEPGGLLAGYGARCEIRLLVYRGSRVENTDTPNLRKQPKSLRGPLIGLIDAAVRAIDDELAEGLTLVGGGFETKHRYTMRVVKKSPGGLPGTITTANIATSGSKARNPLIARALFDFPVRPNIDAGEGVRMMFAEMQHAGLYPPQYREISMATCDLVTVTLLSESKPPLWEAVSDWIDRNGAIANAELRRIGSLDTLKASQQLRRWVEQGMLEMLPDRGKRNTRYRKPSTPPTYGGSLSATADNNGPFAK
jgi:ATP-dependent DNA helicase RecG